MVIRNVYLVEELLALWSGSSEPLWCVIGDFNSVCTSEERRGSSSSPNIFINSIELLYLPLHGRTFTWFRPNGLAVSRLDTTFISIASLDVWPNFFQHVLSRDISDHCPSLLKSSDINWGPKPFCVLNCWLHEFCLKGFVEEEWGTFILKEKLKGLKSHLMIWNS